MLIVLRKMPFVSFCYFIFKNIVTATSDLEFILELFRGRFKIQPAVAIVLNNDNRPEPPVPVGQPPVEFWSRPLFYQGVFQNQQETYFPPKYHFSACWIQMANCLKQHRQRLVFEQLYKHKLIIKKIDFTFSKIIS